MAKYIMREMNDLNGKGLRLRYPRPDLSGMVSTKRLVEDISDDTTFSKGDVHGVLAILVNKIAKKLGEGYSVKIDGLGTFTVSLGLKRGVEPEVVGSEARHNAQSVRIKGVNFRADKEFVEDVESHFIPERSTKKDLRSSDRYDEAERLQLAKDFLSSNPFMRVADYVKLTGLRPSTARTELRRFADTENSGITTTGLGSHTLYVLK